MSEKGFGLGYEDALKQALHNQQDRKLRLSGLFTKRQNAGTARSVLNKLLAEDSSYNNIVLSIAMYPVLQWSLYGEDISEVIDIALETEDTAMFSETRELLRDMFGFDRQIVIRSRETYYDLCHSIIGCLDAAVNKVKMYPKTGPQMARTLLLVMDAQPAGTDGDTSRFEVAKYLTDAVKAMRQICGLTIDSLMSNLLNLPREMMQADDDEAMYLHHNMKILLREYSRLCWGKTEAQDCVGRILHSKTPQEVMGISAQASTVYSADVVLKFLLLVSGAIALVEYYPANGEKYAAILKSLVSNRTVVAPDGSSAYLHEQEIAKLCGMTPQNFSTAKHRAFILLGLLLWGYDGKILSEIVDEESDSQYFIDTF